MDLLISSFLRETGSSVSVMTFSGFTTEPKRRLAIEATARRSSELSLAIKGRANAQKFAVEPLPNSPHQHCYICALPATISV